MNVTEYLISNLRDKFGINDYFGLPGDYNFNIVCTIENDNNLKWIGCTNELNAGYAADGYARQKGFGALVTTYGVGELSAMNAVAGSYAENVPVIHIVGTPDSDTLKGKVAFHHGFQDPKPYNFKEAYQSIVEASAFLSKDNAKIEIDRLLKIFEKERKPIYIAIPEDVALWEISNRNCDYNWVSDNNTLHNVVDLIIKKINNAVRPVIVADTLIKRYDSKAEFVEFVKKSEIPVTNFLMGADICNDDSETYLGTYLSKYGNPQAKESLEKSDCLISVGVIYGDINSYGTPLPYKINSHIAIYGTYTYVDGEKYDNIKMADVLRELTKKIGNKGYKLERPSIGYEKSNTSREKLTLNYIYPRLQEFFRGEDIIFAETGLVTQGIAMMKLPENSVLHNQLLWSSIGWALPAAFGAAIANPKARIIVVTGDGAHQISAMEVGSMCRYGVKPIVIVINNGGYSIERYLSEKPEARFNDIMQMDYAKFARSFKGDIWATKVETADDFDKALRVTQIMDKLCYIESIVDKSDLPQIAAELFTGKVSPKKKNPSVSESDSINKQDLTVSNEENFETSVHTSLKDYEE